MVTFRRRKKSLDMQENKASDETRANPDAAADEIKVTDRRRINLDSETTASGGEGEGREEPRLKPRYVEELEARTRAAEQKVADVQGRFEQLRAQLQRDTDETRQRLNKAADERAKREKVEFITSLLPVADNLKRAIEAAESGGSLEALLDGVHGTSSGFENALIAAGVEPVPSVGTHFDPQLHEAVDTVEVEPELDGTVTAEYSRGYRIGDRLIQPARVQVGRARASQHRQQAAE
jgi:molecular chaperone GrpE